MEATTKKIFDSLVGSERQALPTGMAEVPITKQFVQAMLDEAVTKMVRMIRRVEDERTGKTYYWFPKWKKHQCPNRPRQSTIKPVVEELLRRPQTPTPSSLPPLGLGPRSTADGPATRTRRPSANEIDVTDISSEWGRVFGKPIARASRAQKILGYCVGEQVDPVWFLEYLKSYDPRDPWAYAMTVMKAPLEVDDGIKRTHSWWTWSMRSAPGAAEDCRMSGIPTEAGALAVELIRSLGPGRNG